MHLPRYDLSQSYDWNYRHPPEVTRVAEPAVAGRWMFCGRVVASPLGVAAGPLLNGAWCRYYAHLGFDVVTYKTVRSGPRACYPLPNLLPVACGTLQGGEEGLPAAERFDGSWAVSFGMPSQPPDVWTEDVRQTRRQLPPEKLLSVSVVGTSDEGDTIDHLADDYATCAALAAEHGADSVEFNLSCPNVTSCDGQLYQQPGHAALVARRVRQAVGRLPLLVKVGHFRDPAGLRQLIDAVAGDVDAVVMTNCVPATVADGAGARRFNGQQRGIAGRSILDASVAQVEVAAEHIANRGLPMRVIGVGGIFTAADVQRYLSAGAEGVQLATALMIDPEVGLKIRRQLSQPGA